MASRLPVRLDRDGTAPLPLGYTAVGTEVEFVRHALSTPRLQVRGEALSRWAEAFYRGRGVPCEWLTSPSQMLRTVVPALAAEQAAEIVARLGDAVAALGEPMSVSGLLPRLVDGGPWSGGPSLEHAATWLLWLDAAAQPSHVGPLLAAQAATWRSAAIRDDELAAYGAASSVEASQVLSRWLGIDAPLPKDWRPFPIEVPEPWVARARAKWSTIIVDSAGDALAGLMGRRLPHTLAVAVAEEGARFYRANPARANRAAIGLIAGHMPYAAVVELEDLCPPSVPRDPPPGLADLAEWFSQDYLPYRAWEAERGDDEAHEHVNRVAIQFAHILLSQYPSALHRGDPLLAIAKAARLAAGDGVLFWIVLDGLTCADAAIVERAFGREHRFTVLTHEAAVTALPTVTEFCKEAILKGLPPKSALDKSQSARHPSAKTIAGHRDPATELRDAVAGDVFIWKPVEPDATYHASGDATLVRPAARKRVEALSEAVVRAALAVPDGADLRVVVTADHGRLLGGGARRHPVPDGMSAQGRAAWGASSLVFPESGYVTDDAASVAFLSASAFGLPESVCVPLDAGAFLTEDGRRGPVEFAHGGIFPEEVFVPWIVVARDFVAPTVTCALTGSATAGTRSLMAVHLVNAGSVPVQVRDVELRLANRSLCVPLAASVAPSSSADLTAPVESWPGERELTGATASVTVAVPAGRSFQVAADLTISTREMYRRAIDLEDL